MTSIYKTKKAARPTDPLLLATARLDRLLADLPREAQQFALGYLMMKYGNKGGGSVRQEVTS